MAGIVRKWLVLFAVHQGRYVTIAITSGNDEKKRGQWAETEENNNKREAEPKPASMDFVRQRNSPSQQ
jgi:hypothetical protein